MTSRDDRALRTARRRAQQFVASAGGPLARLRGRALEQRAEDMRALLQHLEAAQAADGSIGPLGGVPPRSAGVAPGRSARESGSERATATLSTVGALALLEAHGLAASAVGAGAAGWLAGQVRRDGCVPPGPDATEEETLLCTAHANALWARTGRARPRRLAAAGDWLAARFDPGLVRGAAGYAALAAFAHYFTGIPHDASDGILQWCGRELERGFRTGTVGAVAAARVLLLCDALALPGARVDASELAVALVATQADDGGLPAASPEPWDRALAPCDAAAAGALERVAATLDALTALSRWLPGGPRRHGAGPGPG